MNFNVGIKHNSLLDNSDESDVEPYGKAKRTSKSALFDDMVFDDTASSVDSSFQHGFATSKKQLVVKKQKKQQVHSLPSAKANQPKLKSTFDLPDSFREIFCFTKFNKMQSEAFDYLYGDNVTKGNCIISAPTGAGKTVLFELAMLNVFRHTTDYSNVKFVYIAPTKSLCMEKFESWKSKFKKVKVGFLTSDTSEPDAEVLGRSCILVTTPEKWDLLTRKWTEYKNTFDMLRLCMVDEIHTLKDMRGPVLEAVLTRMNRLCPNMKIIAVSATIPNISDIATWLRDYQTNEQALFLEYDESYRAVQLEKHVIGCSVHSKNDFQAETIYTSKLPSIVDKYSEGKPVLIFCSTRNSASVTAKYLAKHYKKTKNTTGGLADQVSESQLRECCKQGVAYHHAGLSYADRKLVENMFLTGSVHTLCSTSTLAVGVNLPAYLVIIKGTKMWSFSGYKEYSELDMLQMIGRAGRPQFETSGCAVIMTSNENQQHYDTLLAGTEDLESLLHLSLAENVCAEIELGTIENKHSALEWIEHTFFYIRFKKNPQYYKLGSRSNSPDAVLQNLSEEVIEKLIKCQVVVASKNSDLECTEYGVALSKHYVSLTTLQVFVECAHSCSLSAILRLLSKADEFSRLKVKHNEKTFYRDLNQNQGIRFQHKEKGKNNPVIHETEQKVSLLIQQELGGVDLSACRDYGRLLHALNQDKFFLFKHCLRILKCMVDCFVKKKDGISLKNTLLLMRSINGKCWDDSPMVLRQIQNIGVVSVRKLAKHGVNSIKHMKVLTATQIEYYLGLNVAGGIKFKNSVALIPELKINVSEPVVTKLGSALMGTFKIKIKADFPYDSSARQKNYADILCVRNDGLLVDFRRILVSKIQNSKVFTLQTEFDDLEHDYCFSIGCEEIAGINESCVVDTRKYVPADAAKSVGLSLEDSDTDEDIVQLLQHKGHCAKALSENHKDGNDNTNSSNHNKNRINKNSNHHKESAGKKEERKRLDNGNFACLHTCRDKMSCRHLCCKEGVLECNSKANSRHNTGTSSLAIPKRGSENTFVSVDETKEEGVKLPKLHTEHDMDVFSLSSTSEEDEMSNAANDYSITVYSPQCEDAQTVNLIEVGVPSEEDDELLKEVKELTRTTNMMTNSEAKKSMSVSFLTGERKQNEESKHYECVEERPEESQISIADSVGSDVTSCSLGFLGSDVEFE
ncbi:hypothetical protein ACO0QE_000924 [Hanseniaspora vineae]